MTCPTSMLSETRHDAATVAHTGKDLFRQTTETAAKYTPCVENVTPGPGPTKLVSPTQRTSDPRGHKRQSFLPALTPNRQLICHSRPIPVRAAPQTGVRKRLGGKFMENPFPTEKKMEEGRRPLYRPADPRPESPPPRQYCPKVHQPFPRDR